MLSLGLCKIHPALQSSDSHGFGDHSVNERPLAAIRSSGANLNGQIMKKRGLI